MAVQYISLRDQGYGDSSQRLMEAGRQLFAMRLQQEQAKREQEAFKLEQRQRAAAALMSETNAGAQPATIADAAALRQLQLQQGQANLTQTQALNPIHLKAAEAGLQHEQNQLEADPVALALTKAHLAAANQSLVPTDETAETSTDPLGNITETIKRTKNGQPFGSTSKVIRGNRPNAAKTNVVYYPETDPETGVTQRVPYTVGVDTAGNPIRNPLPVAVTPGGEPQAPDITSSVLNKYFNPDGSSKKTGGFLGMFQKNAVDNPSSITDAQALDKLRKNPTLQAKLGVHLDPASNSLGEPSRPAVPAAGVSPSASKNGGETATPKTTPTTFDKLEVGKTFWQNGTQYVKTGPRSAKPVKDTQSKTTPDTPSAPEVDSPNGP